jgi:transposase-like protein
MSPTKKLTNEERRRLTLAALRGVSVAKLTREYGVNRSYAYLLMNEAKADPDATYEEARREAAFRKEVRDLLSS